MNLNVPPKKTRTHNVTYVEQIAQGEAVRNALLRALAERPGLTVRELCVMVGRTSTSSVQHHLYKLEDMGKIVRDSCPLCRAKIWRMA